MRTGLSHSLKHVLNCFYRETREYEIIDDSWMSISLPFAMSLRVAITRSSCLQAPSWVLPMFLCSSDGTSKQVVSDSLAIHLILDVCAKTPTQKKMLPVALTRILNSAENLHKIMDARSDNIDLLFQDKVNFIESEQGLWQGHTLQPDPKSRIGFSEKDFQQYSPEMQGQFQIYYWAVSPEYIDQNSAEQLRFSDVLARQFPEQQRQYPEYVLFPLHPWQASYLSQQPVIKALVAKKAIVDIGPLGELFYPTTSVRTLCPKKSAYMLKFSLSVAITNSVRINLAKETQRSLAVYQMNAGPLGTKLKETFPHFQLITDPAYMALQIDGVVIDESICIVRDNPFQSDNNVTCMASLCQTHPLDKENRLSALVTLVAQRESITRADAASKWYQCYLQQVFAPVLWLYSEYGLALEAHQQNLLMCLEDGLPTGGYYRDSQGYYYLKQDNPALFDIVPDAILAWLCDGDKDFVDHHFAYYFISNQLLALIEALAKTGFVTENTLLNETHRFLAAFAKQYQTQGHFVDYLLTEKSLPSKANLLTRLQGLDELVAPLTEQSVYNEIKNPFYLGEAV